MSTRKSGFDKIPNDLFETPHWVVDALAEHVNLTGLSVWEPACGGGKMVRALIDHGAHVTATDLNDQNFEGMADQFDFVHDDLTVTRQFYFDSIITNPPYGPQGRIGAAFIQRGLERLPPGGLLAMLLPVDFDSAKGRAPLFGDNPDFAAKIVLRRRINWFDPKPGEKVGQPSANHAWFVWCRSHLRHRAVFTLYAPSSAVEKINTTEAA